MSYIVTQTDIDLLYQSEKTIYIKLDLLNKDNKIINSLESELISASVTNDSESAVRCNFTAVFYVKDNSWLIGMDKKIWIDRKVCPYIGYYSIKEKEIVWYKVGILKFYIPAFTYNADTKEVSIQCVDLMSTLNGDLSGTIISDKTGADNVLIEAGANLRNTVISLLNDAGIKDYNVCNFTREVPYDIEIDIGSTYYSILEELINLYSGYEFFFDENGIFTMQLKPLLKSELPVLTDNILSSLIISEDQDYDFSSIANYCEVYGESIEPDYYSDVCSGTSSLWTSTNKEVSEYKTGDKYAIKAPVDNTSPLKIRINSFPFLEVYDDDGNLLKAGKCEKDNIYCFKYSKSDNRLILLGSYQAFGVYEEKNKDCPFSTANLGYKINKVINDDNIYSNSLCEQRAKYEIYLSSWLNDTINLEMIDIPFLKVNQKISYKTKTENIEREYIVKSINRDIVSGTMKITIYRFSEEYPDMETIYKTQNLK